MPEIERFDPKRERTLEDLHREYVDGEVCPDCGAELHLVSYASTVEVRCEEECEWWEEVLQ